MAIARRSSSRAAARGSSLAADWTGSLAAAAQKLGVKSAIIDGEVVFCDEDGRPDFKDLKSAIRSKPECLLFMAFDLLHLDGQDIWRIPVEDRRQLLHELFGPEHNSIRFSEGLEGDAEYCVQCDRQDRARGDGLEAQGQPLPQW